jgi:hypothetical protein
MLRRYYRFGTFKYEPRLVFHNGTRHFHNKTGLISLYALSRESGKLTAETNRIILLPDVCLLLLAILSRPTAGR